MINSLSYSASISFRTAGVADATIAEKILLEASDTSLDSDFDYVDEAQVLSVWRSKRTEFK